MLVTVVPPRTAKLSYRAAWLFGRKPANATTADRIKDLLFILNVPFICSAAARKGVPADFPFGNIFYIIYDTSGKSCARYGVFPYGVFTPSRMVANPALTSPVGMA